MLRRLLTPQTATATAIVFRMTTEVIPKPSSRLPVVAMMLGRLSGAFAMTREKRIVASATKTHEMVARTSRPSGAANLRSMRAGHGARATAIRTGGTTCRETQSHWRLLMSVAKVGSMLKMPGTPTAIWIAAPADHR